MKTPSIVSGLLTMIFCFSALALEPIKEAEDRLQADAPAIVAAAQSKSKSQRARAALALGRIQSATGINTLLTLAQDKNDKVRAMALWACGQLGWKPSFSNGREGEIAEVVAQSLAHPNWRLRQKAVEAVGKIGLTKAPQFLIPHLSDTKAQVRAETLMALFRYRFVLRLRDANGVAPELPAEVFAEMAKLATDKDKAVRRNLVYSFARFKEPRASDLLVKLSTDRDLWTRFFAVTALSKISTPSVWPALETALRDHNGQVRLAAVAGAIALKKSETLVPLIKDKDLHVRSAVVAALAASEEMSITIRESLLNAALGDSSSEVRVQAVSGLATLKKAEAFDILRGVLADRSEYVRAAAVTASVALGDRQDEFLRGVDVDPAVVDQNAYLNVLGAMTSPETFARILLGLKSERIDVRIGAADALYSRKDSEVIQIAWKTYQENRLPVFDRVRESLIYTIAKVESEQTTQYLREMLSDPDFDVASVAHQFLTLRKVPDLPPAPKRILTFSPFREETFTHNPQVTLYTTKGPVHILCFAKQAPVHVANFVGLARNGFYDGKPWFRVVPNFVVQGGASDEMGMQGANYNLRAEINGIPFRRGTLGMPRADDFNTGDLQVFLTHVPTPHLDGQYTVFGQIVSGWQALDHLEQGDQILRAVVR